MSESNIYEEEDYSYGEEGEDDFSGSLDDYDELDPDQVLQPSPSQQKQLESDIMMMEDEEEEAEDILLNHFSSGKDKVLLESKHLQEEFALQDHFKSSDMSNLPAKSINDEQDIFDFLLFEQDTPLDQLLTDLENMILSMNESPFVYLRIGKLFNFCCRKIELLFDKSDIFSDGQQLNELRDYLELFHRCIDAVKYTQFSAICLMPEYRMQLDINKKLFDKLLKLITTTLDQMPDDLDKQLIRFMLFIMNTPDPYTTPLTKPAEDIFNYIQENLYDNPNHNFFRFLTIAFWAAPPRMTSRYIEEIIAVLKPIVESSLQMNMVSAKQVAQELIPINDDEREGNAEDETNYQILKFLLIAMNNEKVRKLLLSEDFHKHLFEILKDSSPKAYSLTIIKLSPRISKIIVSILSNLIPDLGPKQLENFREALFWDICMCIEAQEIDFIVRALVPLMACASYKSSPVFIHLDEDMEVSLDKHRSKKKPLAIKASKLEGQQSNMELVSDILSNQESTSLLQSIQRMSLHDEKSNKDGNSHEPLSSAQWKQNFKVNFLTQYPSQTKPLHEAVQQTDGVLFIFECLVNDEVCKIGAFCAEPMTNPDGQSNHNYNHQSTSSKLCFATQKNFLFYYSASKKLHFCSDTDSKQVEGHTKRLHQYLHKTEYETQFSEQFDWFSPSLSKQLGAGLSGTLAEQSKQPSAILSGFLDSTKKVHSSTGKSKLDKMKEQQLGKPFMLYNDTKITIMYKHTPVLEYYPNYPDRNKIFLDLSKMVSEEEKKGYIPSHPVHNPDGCSFIQSMECWLLKLPKIQHQSTGAEALLDVRSLSRNIVEEHFSYFRNQPVTLAPPNLTIEQLLSVLLTDCSKATLEKIYCKILPQEPIEKIFRVQRVLEMFKGKQSNVLDLFISSSEGSEWLSKLLNNQKDKVYKKLEKISKKQAGLMSGILEPTKLQQIIKKIAIIASKNNKEFLTDYTTFMTEVEVFLQMTEYHQALVENEMFFIMLLQIMSLSIKNDIRTYKNELMFMKLEKVLFETLNSVFKKESGDKLLEQVKVVDLIHILLTKMCKMHQTVDSRDGFVQASGVEYLSKSNTSIMKSFHTTEHKKKLLKDAQDNERSQYNITQNLIAKKILKHVVFCSTAVFSQKLSTELKKEAVIKIKQFKIIEALSAILGEYFGDQRLQDDVYKQLLTLLKHWADDPYFSEVFWEPVSKTENRNLELDFTMYQMCLSYAEQAKAALRGSGEEESKSADASHKPAQSEQEKHKLIIDCFNTIKKSLQKYYYIDIVEQTTDLSKYLELPVEQAFSKILKPMCVDSCNLKASNGTYEHHYKAQINSNPNPQKTQRLVKELNDLTTSLPVSETNAIFVRYDTRQMDVMKALVFGSKDTPYAHGAFIYDIHVGDNYPNGPPACNLQTTGNRTVRFNPNLYQCGKVCLSLLGTWRGSAHENWNPKMSTILQVLVSIQSIIMTEDVYYNEPGYEKASKNAEGRMLNEGYSNVVKYANVKFAMVEMLKNPPKWYRDVINIHFYLKKSMILAEVDKWLLEAKSTQGKYTGLVRTHNNSLASQFSASPSAYHDKLFEASKELRSILANLNLVIEQTVKSRVVQRKRKPGTDMDVEEEEDKGIDFYVQKMDDIDVTYEEAVQQRAIDIKDENVTNRWSRYIGAMGIEAVEKQANAQLCIFGLNALGVEIAKNIILSGVKRFTICDGKKVEYEDLAGQFYLSEDDIGKNRAKACMSKLQALNQYVQIDYIDSDLQDCCCELDKFLVGYNLAIACEGNHEMQTILNDYCRSVSCYFISASNVGLFSRVFCDFGENFKVLDKTGEEYQDLVLKSISSDNKGLVELLEGTKHNLQDGDEITIAQVVEDKSDLSKRTINDTHHKVTVVDKNRFYIGDTTLFRPYQRNGVMRQLKQSATLQFRSLSELAQDSRTPLPPFDPAMSSSDWNFMPRILPLHVAYQKLETLSQPKPWSEQDAASFLNEVAGQLRERYSEQWNEIDRSSSNKELFERIVNTFAYTCQGVFPPLAAFIGGVVAQEAIKAITKKYMPIHQLFYYECSEVVSGLEPPIISQEIKSLEQNRDVALAKCVGKSIMSLLASTKLFMVGSGAIGCELLKNFAMISLGSSKQDGKEGRIYLTDPDVIENSNLNRQFLFREKHIRKSKSTTAAAVAVAMNRHLKGNVMPLVEKVWDQTERIFTNGFFENLDVVTNALDNINARRYVDARCVQARTSLLESGTLGPKGHVQVVVPFKTESYGSQQDPQEENEIPYCTLKMFPEETLHCVEWARDKFNKMFTQKPRSFEKAIESAKTYDDLMTQEHTILAEALRFLKSWPKTFDDCIIWARNKYQKYFVNDIKQLLHVYPLDHKLDNGSLFWTLPKRPPTPVKFDVDREVHVSFIAACACLKAATCNIPVPDDPRGKQSKLHMAVSATKHQIKEFVQSDKKTKSLKDQVNKGKEAGMEEEKEVEAAVHENKEDIVTEILSCIKARIGDLSLAKEKLKCSPQEFEKDEDQNFHIDTLYAMTNCRALNYGLEKMDWITVKLKAGRIIPALATTTSAIAGLQTIELVKIIAAVKVEHHKNSFLNLSIPILAQSEPSEPPKHTLAPGLKVNLWDRWDISIQQHKEIINIKTLFHHLQNLTSLEPMDLLIGNTAVYVSALMSMPGKQKERERLLTDALVETLGLRTNQKHVDVTVTFTSEQAKAKDPKDPTIKGVPLIRIQF